MRQVWREQHLEDPMTQVLGWLLIVAVVAVGIALPVWWISQTPQASSTPDQPLPLHTEPEDDNNPPVKMTEFATGKDAKEEVAPAKFDEQRALKYLKQL